MKVITIINDGLSKLAIIPETDIERDILKRLGDCKASLMTDNVSIFSESLNGALILSNEKNETDKTSK